jgi:hypothetical protein
MKAVFHLVELDSFVIHTISYYYLKTILPCFLLFKKSSNTFILQLKISSSLFPLNFIKPKYLNLEPEICSHYVHKH